MVAFATEGVPTFLVGDSATGVPFFRALNNGLQCGTRLAKTLATLLHHRMSDQCPSHMVLTYSSCPSRTSRFVMRGVLELDGGLHLCRNRQSAHQKHRPQRLGHNQEPQRVLADPGLSLTLLPADFLSSSPSSLDHRLLKGTHPGHHRSSRSIRSTAR